MFPKISSFESQNKLLLLNELFFTSLECNNIQIFEVFLLENSSSVQIFLVRMYTDTGELMTSKFPFGSLIFMLTLGLTNQMWKVEIKRKNIAFFKLD